MHMFVFGSFRHKVRFLAAVVFGREETNVERLECSVLCVEGIAGISWWSSQTDCVCVRLCVCVFVCVCVCAFCSSVFAR